MTRPFWTRPDRSDPDTCETLISLISSYADGMASPDEMLRVESHLPSCPACRQSLLWMQATHRALANRPLVLPPPDLRARIARSIVEADAMPSLLRPARVFTLRPAYAAAASLSVVAAVVVSYGLMHTQPQPHVAPTGQITVATMPKATLTLPVKSVVPKAAVKTAPTHSLVAQISPSRLAERVASKVPQDEPETPIYKALPLISPPTHADVPTPKVNAVGNTLIRVRSRVLPHVKPTSPHAPLALMASGHIPARSPEGKVPKADALEAKHTNSVVAPDKVLEARVPIQVEAPVVTNDTPPVVRTASSDLLGAVHAYVHVHQTGFEHDLSLAGRTAVRTAVRTGDFTAVASTDGGHVDIVH